MPRVIRVRAALAPGLLACWLAAWSWHVGAAWAATGVECLHQRVAALALRPVPPLRVVRQHCGDDALCAGRLLWQALGPRAALLRVVHPDADTIRMARVRPSVTAVRQQADVSVHVRLTRFGLKAVPELRAALRRSPAGRRRLVLDLRGNGGGDMRRMLRLAALFTGAVRRAVLLRQRDGVCWLDVPNAAGGRLWLARGLRLDVLIGPETASSAEVFAALLRRHAGARLWGKRSHGKDWLLSAVPANHDWQLLVPSASIAVPGETLHGGLYPDGPMLPEGSSGQVCCTAPLP